MRFTVYPCEHCGGTGRINHKNKKKKCTHCRGRGYRGKFEDNVADENGNAGGPTAPRKEV